MWHNAAVKLTGGDPYLVMMAIVAAVATGIFFERVIMLQYVYNLNVRKFVNSLSKMVAVEDYERAITFCRGLIKFPVPRIALRALEALENDPTQVRSKIEQEAMETIPQIEKRVSTFHTFATMTLFIGILGNVSELWDSFHAIDVLNTPEQQARLTGTLADALVYTAVGLAAGIMILMMHQITKGLAISVLDKFQYSVTAVTNLLAPSETIFAATNAPISDMAPTVVEEQPEEQKEEKEPVSELEPDTVEDIKDEEEII